MFRRALAPNGGTIWTLGMPCGRALLAMVLALEQLAQPTRYYRQRTRSRSGRMGWLIQGYAMAVCGYAQAAFVRLLTEDASEGEDAAPARQTIAAYTARMEAAGMQVVRRAGDAADWERGARDAADGGGWIINRYFLPHEVLGARKPGLAHAYTLEDGSPWQTMLERPWAVPARRRLDTPADTPPPDTPQA